MSTTFHEPILAPSSFPTWAILQRRLIVEADKDNLSEKHWMPTQDKSLASSNRDLDSSFYARRCGDTCLAECVQRRISERYSEYSRAGLKMGRLKINLADASIGL